MPGGFTPLLERRPVFHSRNVDQTRAFLGAKEFRLDLDRRVVGHLDVRINGVFMPSMNVGYIQYGAPVSVGATPVDPDYWLQLPIRGDFETTVGRESVPCDACTVSCCRPCVSTRCVLRRPARGSTWRRRRAH
jgi:hypothetical protein